MAISRRSRRLTNYKRGGSTSRMVAPGGRRSRYSRVGGRSRAASISRMSRKMNVHHFKQVCIPQNLAYTASAGNANGVYDALTGQLVGPSNTGTTGFFGLDFRFSDIPNVTSMSTLFDSYRINKVVVSFTPVHNISPTNSLGTPADSIPTPLYTIVDYDDSAAPTTQTEVEQYETVKQTAAFRPHYRSLTPAVAQAVYRTGVTFAYMPAYKKWLDLATNDVPHYGLKGMILGNSTPANNAKCAWNVRATYYISLKGVR